MARSVTHTAKSGRLHRANTWLWAAQGVLAAVFLCTGAVKLALPAAQLTGPIELPVAFLRFIGACELIGALGLVLPGLTRIATWLTPLAAACLVIIMAGATTLTSAGMGLAPALVPLIVGLLAGCVAYGRGRPVLAARLGVGVGEGDATPELRTPVA